MFNFPERITRYIFFTVLAIFSTKNKTMWTLMLLYLSWNFKKYFTTGSVVLLSSCRLPAKTLNYSCVLFGLFCQYWCFPGPQFFSLFLSIPTFKIGRCPLFVFFGAKDKLRSCSFHFFVLFLRERYNKHSHKPAVIYCGPLRVILRSFWDTVCICP